MVVTVFTTLLLGFALGMRHATDADHVVAVTTIVSRQRTVRAASLVGAVWGLGHTMTLFVVGGAIILFGVVVPPRLGLAMEFAVGVMLVALGVLNLRGGTDHAHDPAHGATDAAQRARPRALQLARSLIVGVVHGLAGSAAIALLVLTTIRDARVALVYLVLFGGGTVLGMALLTSIIALPFAIASDRFATVNRRMVQVTSALSVALGVFLAYKFGVADGLFSATPRWTPE